MASRHTPSIESWQGPSPRRMRSRSSSRLDWQHRNWHQQRLDHWRPPCQESFESGDIGYHRSTYLRVDVRIATHDDLICEQNQAHMSLEHKYDLLHACYLELKELVTTNRNVPTCSTRAPAVISTLPDPKYPFYGATYPSKKDYPDIRFWSWASYNMFIQEKKSNTAVFNPTGPQHQRGGAQLAQNDENMQDDFIEEEDGTIASGSVAAGICKVARDAFRELNEDHHIVLPKKFTQISPSSQKFVLNKLYAQFPYLQLCTDNWKAELILSCVYSGMNSTRAQQEQNKVKAEAVVAAIPTSPSQATTNALSTLRKQKNPSSSDDASRSKRQHSLHASSLLPSVQLSSSPFIDLTKSRPLSPPAQASSSHAPSIRPPNTTVPKPQPRPCPITCPTHTNTLPLQKKNPAPFTEPDTAPSKTVTTTPTPTATSSGNPLPTVTPAAVLSTKSTLPTTASATTSPIASSSGSPASQVLPNENKKSNKGFAAPMPTNPPPRTQSCMPEGPHTKHNGEKSNELVNPFKDKFGPATSATTHLQSLQSEKAKKATPTVRTYLPNPVLLPNPVAYPI
ncbi:hypothetical protein B0H34DRAFT_736077 [Crassisporium funariophilum]|nr:hypothetical protein B0H34DRAFT_736077 [Crassisporium funariophilum]